MSGKLPDDVLVVRALLKISSALSNFDALVDNDCPGLTRLLRVDIERFFNKLGYNAEKILKDMSKDSLNDYLHILESIDEIHPVSCPDGIFEFNFSLLLAKIQSAVEDLRSVNAQELKKSGLSAIVTEAKILLNKKYIRYSRDKKLDETILAEFSEIADEIS